MARPKPKRPPREEPTTEPSDAPWTEEEIAQAGGLMILDPNVRTPMREMILNSPGFERRKAYHRRQREKYRKEHPITDADIEKWTEFLEWIERQEFTGPIENISGHFNEIYLSRKLPLGIPKDDDKDEDG